MLGIGVHLGNPSHALRQQKGRRGKRRGRKRFERDMGNNAIKLSGKRYYRGRGEDTGM